jgi:DNA-binding winged helix-turn-helix (wHTH) protein
MAALTVPELQLLIALASRSQRIMSRDELTPRRVPKTGSEGHSHLQPFYIAATGR